MSDADRQATQALLEVIRSATVVAALWMPDELFDPKLCAEAVKHLSTALDELNAAVKRAVKEEDQ